MTVSNRCRHCTHEQNRVVERPVPVAVAAACQLTVSNETELDRVQEHFGYVFSADYEFGLSFGLVTVICSDDDRYRNLFNLSGIATRFQTSMNLM